MSSRASAEIAAHELAQGRVILGHQYRRAAGHHPLRPCRSGPLPGPPASRQWAVAALTAGATCPSSAAGTENEMIVPLALLSAQIFPPCASTKALQIARPSPVPPERCWWPRLAR